MTKAKLKKSIARQYFQAAMLFFISSIFIIACSKNSNLNNNSNSSLPTTPNNLNAAPASISEIDLTWTDNSSNETGFKIERKTGNGSFTQIDTVPSNVTNYVDLQVTINTNYTYRVISYNSSGNAAQYSNEATAIINTSGGQVPLPPVDLVLSYVTSNTQIKLDWIDNSTNETGFKIERRTDGGTFAPIATVGANITTYTDNGLSPNTNYTYRVYSFNASGFSATYSNVSTLNTLGSVYFSMPFDSLVVQGDFMLGGARTFSVAAIKFDSLRVQPFDVHVNLTVNPTLVSADPTAQLLSPSLYNTTLVVTIPAGSQIGYLNIDFPEINNIIPSILGYGLGLTISSVDNGFSVNNTFKNTYIKFQRLNFLDGRYSLNFTNVHPTYNPNGQGSTINVELRTTGEYSVKLYSPDLGGYYLPAMINGSLNAFANQEPEYMLDPSNGSISVQNSSPNAGAVFSMYPGYNSYFSYGSRMLYAKFGYSNDTRYWTQEFTYLGPR